MIVKKTIAFSLFCALAVLSVACSGGDATPTRTRVAEAQPTQTPWIIYVPVTVTPGPATATLEPTSTPSAPQPTAVPPTQIKPTARPHTPVPVVQATATLAVPPTAEPPTATPAPSCGQPYQVTTLTFPENGAKRRASPKSGAGATIQFKFDPVVAYEIDPSIGYRVNISTKRNSAALYISHNKYLSVMKLDGVVLNQQATYGLTQGDDATAEWSVDVIKVSTQFNDSGDDGVAPLGTITPCGPTSPTFTIELAVEG